MNSELEQVLSFHLKDDTTYYIYIDQYKKIFIRYSVTSVYGLHVLLHLYL